MKRAGFLIAWAAVAACASPGVPPGGPVDTEAPKILGIAPDSGKTGVTPKHVVFRFDEVVSERPTGVPSLSGLFLISPRDGDPRVDWNRDEVAVRPRRGWKKNTAYTITMLPGMADLRGNVRNVGAVTMFATGATIPTSRISGTLFNWPEARVIVRGGLVEARPRADTTIVYVAKPDTIGVYQLANLPPDIYLVRGISDDNNNRGLDPREAWDTVAVSLRDTAILDFYTFVHDSLGVRLQTIAVRDSVTIELSFDNPLSLSQPLTVSNIHVVGADSAAIGVVSVTAPPPDTTAAVRRLKRPIPTRSVTVRLARPLVTSARYSVRVTGVRNLGGIVRNTESLLRVPASFPAAPLRAPATAPPPAPPPSAPVRR